MKDASERFGRKLNPVEAALYKTYTRDFGGVCNLVIGNQRFAIDCGSKTHKQAKWVREQLAHALAKMGVEQDNP